MIFIVTWTDFGDQFHQFFQTEQDAADYVAHLYDEGFGKDVSAFRAELLWFKKGYIGDSP